MMSNENGSKVKHKQGGKWCDYGMDKCQ